MGLAWVWRNRQQFRPRRAYFRPNDALDLDAVLVNLSGRIVRVQLVSVADADSPLAGQRLYRILDHQCSSQAVRPERDFDFLD